MTQPYGPGAPGFGLVSAGTVGFLVVLAAVSVWVVRLENLLRRVGARVCATAPIGRVAVWARERIGAGRWALVRRLPAYGLAGGALLIGVAGVAAMAAGFTELLEDVLDGDGVAGVDQPVSRWLAGHRDLWLTTTLRVVTKAGDPLPLAALVVLACGAVGWRYRSRLPAMLALAGVSGIALIIVTAKALVNRDRPPSPFALIAVDGYSFPSGHATGTAAVALLSAWMLTHWLITSWTGRVIVWTVAVGVVSVVGFSRVYLGVHYVSDVLAGWLLGTAWAGVVVLVGFWWDNTRRARGTVGFP